MWSSVRFCVLFLLAFSSKYFSTFGNREALPHVNSHSNDASIDQIILIGTADGNLHAFDSALTKIWTTSTGNPLIYTKFPETSNQISDRRAIPTVDGSILWKDKNGFSKSSITAQSITEQTPFLTKDGLLLTGRKSSKVFGLNLRDGIVTHDFDIDYSKHRVKNGIRKSRVPVWIGRVDYLMKGIDTATGDTEFDLSYSELFPVISENEHTMTSERALILSNGVKDGGVIPFRVKSLISNPDGSFIFYGDQEALHSIPLELNSPIVCAYNLKFLEDVPQFHSKIAIHHSLHDLRSYHKISPRSKSLFRPSEIESKTTDVSVLIQPARNGHSVLENTLFAIEVESHPLHQLEENHLPILQGLPNPSNESIAFGTQKFGRRQIPTLATKRVRKAFLPSPSNLPFESEREKSSEREIHGLHNLHLGMPIDDSWLFDVIDKSRMSREQNAAQSQTDIAQHNELSSWKFSKLIVVFFLVISSFFLFYIATKSFIRTVPDSNLMVSSSSSDLSLGSMKISDKILGYGSHGTVVFHGELNGRAIAVKRMLSQFNKSIDREIANLIKSDGHPNVVRYYMKEEKNDFVYLGLQLCEMSLKDFINTLRTSNFPKMQYIDDEIRFCLQQIAEGLAFLHSCKIVHRDIKPHNILCEKLDKFRSTPNNISTLKDIARYTLKISDMGLSKQLEMDEHSFSSLSLICNEIDNRRRDTSESNKASIQSIVGTVGWQAPELIEANVISDFPGSSSRKTLNVDVFSLGCVFYYILTIGDHPFGKWYEREANIVNGKVDLGMLDTFPDAVDLLKLMLHKDPSYRPSSIVLLNHPFFWIVSKRLDFLLEFSDRIEKEPSDSPVILDLEKLSNDVIYSKWDKKIDQELLEDIGKYRKYDSTSVRDLLRLIRNKKHHYHELSGELKEKLGQVPLQYYSYFESRFPKLFFHCASVAAKHLNGFITPWWEGNISVQISPPVNDFRHPSEIDADKTDTDRVQNITIWNDSTLQTSLQSKGWWREKEDWIVNSRAKNLKKNRPSHILKAATDFKYRTRLCTHWESTLGGTCPMRKKGKCIFAHGALELRVKDTRRDKWGKANNGSNQATQKAEDLNASGGEDVLGAARSIEKIRQEEGSYGDFERQNYMIPSFQPLSSDFYQYSHQYPGNYQQYTAESNFYNYYYPQN